MHGQAVDTPDLEHYAAIALERTQCRATCFNFPVADSSSLG